MLGSSAVPPTFPAVRIDGEAYWDGGIYSNTPVEAVFDDYPRRSSVFFAVQIWHSRGVEPESVAQVFARQKDIMFSSRSRSHIAAQARLHRLRHVVRTLFDLLPEDKRNTPEVQELADYGCATTMHLLEINAEPLDGETNSREYDFSPATIDNRRNCSSVAIANNRLLDLDETHVSFRWKDYRESGGPTSKVMRIKIATRPTAPARPQAPVT